MALRLTRQCEFVLKGYVVDGNTIYNSYNCLKDKGHTGHHEFYHDELDLPRFKTIRQAKHYRDSMLLSRKES